MKPVLLATTILASLVGGTIATSALHPTISTFVTASILLIGSHTAAAISDDGDEALAKIRAAVFAEDPELDDAEECGYWAEHGECSQNPRYMQENCDNACRRQAQVDREVGKIIESKINHIDSFFELEAQDIDEKTVSFEKFRGQVTVITNVASYCGYTESHYRGLVQLYNQFKDSPVGFNILAFPCNQFGEQEPLTCPEIKRFAERKGVEFTMMNKVDVNGINAHNVYHYLKKVAGPPRITWNFATYYVVTPQGMVTSFNGVEPMDLVPAIRGAMKSAGEDKEL